MNKVGAALEKFKKDVHNSDTDKLKQWRNSLANEASETNLNKRQADVNRYMTIYIDATLNKRKEKHDSGFYNAGGDTIYVLKEPVVVSGGEGLDSIMFEKGKEVKGAVSADGKTLMLDDKVGIPMEKLAEKTTSAIEKVVDATLKVSNVGKRAVEVGQATMVGAMMGAAVGIVFQKSFLRLALAGGAMGALFDVFIKKPLYKTLSISRPEDENNAFGRTSKRVSRGYAGQRCRVKRTMPNGSVEYFEGVWDGKQCAGADAPLRHPIQGTLHY